MAHTIDEYENKLAKLKTDNEQSIQDMEERMKNNEKSIRSELERTVKKAESNIADEKARAKELEEKLQVKLNEAKDVQQTLKNDLELVRGNSFKLEKVRYDDGESFYICLLQSQNVSTFPLTTLHCYTLPPFGHITTGGFILERNTRATAILQCYINQGG